MKIIGIVLIIGIVFSYVPILPMGGCQETNHAGNMKLDCGYIFHCPLLSSIGPHESMTLPYFGRAVFILPLPTVYEFTRPIYHPPKKPHA
jgi:hypothetical protein